MEQKVSPYLFAEWATPRTGSRRRGLRASSGEGWQIPLGAPDFALHLGRKQEAEIIFNPLSHPGDIRRTLPCVLDQNYLRMPFSVF